MNWENLTIEEARKLLDIKKISAQELTNFYLKRIAQVDKKIKVCLSVFEKEALVEAKLADERLAKGEKGALLGIPYLLSDNILVKGQKTSAASKVLADYIAPYDATVVKKLREAGAILLGKTNLDEFASGFSGESSAFFSSKNPWDLERVPGAGSGASAAALSADFCVFALSSDSVNSIRQAASFCNVLALRTTPGSISRFGLISNSSSFDLISPLTKSAVDAQIIRQELAGEDNFDLSALSKAEFATKTKERKEKEFRIKGKNLKGLKIAVIKNHPEQKLDQAIAIALEKHLKLFKSLGAEIEDISLKYDKYAVPALRIISGAELSSALARFDGIRYGYGLDFKPRGKGKDALEEIYFKNRSESFGKDIKREIIFGTYVLSAKHLPTYYRPAMEIKEALSQEFSQIFSKFDIIISPSTAHTAFKLGDKKSDILKLYLEDAFFAAPTLASLPALSLAAGFSQGLPFGMQIIADKYQDDLLLEVAKVFQAESDYHKKFPKINL